MMSSETKYIDEVTDGFLAAQNDTVALDIKDLRNVTIYLAALHGGDGAVTVEGTYDGTYWFNLHAEYSISSGVTGTVLDSITLSDANGMPTVLKQVRAVATGAFSNGLKVVLGAAGLQPLPYR